MSTDTYWSKTFLPDGKQPWVLREVPGKGLAAFATRRFEAGELICREQPTVWVHGHHPFSSEQVAEIESRVGELQEQDKQAFYAMANVFPEAATPAVGIFMTNCFDMTESIHGEACAMYLALARLNHSCAPNAQQTHLPESGEEVLYATRTIELGEEINDCYIDLRQTRDQRRCALLEIYRFTCECASCGVVDGPCHPSSAVHEFEDASTTASRDDCNEGEVEASSETKMRMKSCLEEDARRVRAATLDDLVISVAEDEGPDTALDVALESVRLLVDEQNLPWSVRYVPEAHINVYQIALILNKKKLAKQHLLLAHERNRVLQGEDGPDTISSHSKLDLLRFV